MQIANTNKIESSCRRGRYIKSEFPITRQEEGEEVTEKVKAKEQQPFLRVALTSVSFKSLPLTLRPRPRFPSSTLTRKSTLTLILTFQSPF